MPEVKRASTRWRPSDGKGKVVGLYICTMRRYAPSQYRQVLLRAPTAALYYIYSPTTASTFALACCDDFCQRRAKLYLTYCKRAFGKPQSGKSAQQARVNAYFFRRSVALYSDILAQTREYYSLANGSNRHYTKSQLTGFISVVHFLLQSPLAQSKHRTSISQRRKI